MQRHNNPLNNTAYINNNNGDYPIKTPYRPPPRPAGPRPPRPDRRFPQRPVDDGPRINDQIRAEKVRVVDADGEMRGVMTVREGIAIAEEAGLDLVEVSPNADPPVCKVLDYGKYKYEQQKKAAEARKKQKVVELKEIKIRPNIEKHDYEVKLRNARRFFEEGDKVKFTMRFKGREMSYQKIGFDLLARVQTELADIAKVDMTPKFEGRQVIMILSPLAAAAVKK